MPKRKARGFGSNPPRGKSAYDGYSVSPQDSSKPEIATSQMKRVQRKKRSGNTHNSSTLASETLSHQTKGTLALMSQNRDERVTR